MAVRSLKFVLTGEDKSASKSLDKVGKKADGLGSKFGRMAGAFAGGAAAAGLISFAKGSVAAFKEAEVAQARFNDAFAKFPRLADINKQALADYNSELARKTVFDDDAIGSGQAVLAQFNLTGKQLKEVTPLLLDYASKTGQDLPNAAKALGMAFNGNAKALKQIGITIPKAAAGAAKLATAQRDAARAEDKVTAARRKLKDVQDLLRGKTKLAVADTIKLRNAQFAVKDAEEKHTFTLTALSAAQRDGGKSGDMYSQVMAGLRKQVGGFAVKEGKTAAGQAEILKNQFGEVQEQVGAKLTPVLIKLAGVLLKVVDFIQRNSKVLGPLAVVIGSVVAAVKAWYVAQAILNSTLLANPIGLVVVAIAALAAGLVIAYKKSQTFRTIVQAAFAGVLLGVQALLRGFDYFARASDALFGTNLHEKVRGVIADIDQLIAKITGIPAVVPIEIRARLTGDAAARALLTPTGVSKGTGGAAVAPQPTGLGGFLNQQTGARASRTPEVIELHVDSRKVSSAQRARVTRGATPAWAQ